MRDAGALGLVAFCGLMIVAGLAAAFFQPPRSDPVERSLWDALLWPRERNVMARLPVIAIHLKDVAISPDGERAWAVGAHGAILASADRGRTWTTQTSGSIADLYGIDMLPQGDCGWIVGDRGTILKTSDGGRSWQSQASGTEERLTDVAALADCCRGWIRGLHDSWLMTRDGTQWNRTVGYVPPEAGTIAPEAAEAVRLRLLGTSGLAWADAGRNALPRESFGARFAMAADRRHGIAVDGWGEIRFSDDGGANWHAAANPLAAGLAAVAISVDGRHALAVGDQGAVIASADGGRTWLPRSRGQATIADIALEPGTKTAWAISGSYLLKTSDAGATWLTEPARHSPTTDSPLQAIRVDVDGKHLWIAGRDDVFRSEDGGVSWSGSETPPPFWIHDLAILANGRGWAVGGGSGGWVSATEDGGRTWTAPVHQTPFRLKAVAVSPDGLRILAAGDGPAIVISEDGGQSWRETSVALGRLTGLQDIVIAKDGRRALAVGRFGTWLFTPDGGTAWTIANTNPDAELTDIAVGDDGSGWVGGSDGTLFAVGGFGGSWDQLPLPFRSNITAVAVSPSGFGIAGGAGLNLVHTEDGGRTWLAAEYRRYPAPWTYVWIVSWSVLGLWTWLRR